MERRIEQLEKEVAFIKSQHIEHLKLTKKNFERFVNHVDYIKEEMDNLKFTSEEQIRILLRTQELVEDLKPQLHNKDNVKDDRT